MLRNLTLSLTVGLFLGFFSGILRRALQKHLPGAKKRQTPPVSRMTYLMLFVLLVLAVGLLWTV